MKTNKALKLILGTAASFCFAFGVFSLTDSVLETQAAGESIFAMEERASVRLTEPYGIRFRVQMSEDYKNKIDADGATYGFLIFPYEYLNSIGSDYSKLTEATSVNVQGDKQKIYEENGLYYANGVLAEVKAENISLDFTSVCYIKEGETYTYAALSPDFKRNVTGVAGSAYLYEKEKREALTSAYNTLGTAEMPIEISSVADLTAIASEVNDENKPETFSDVHFKLTADLSVPADFTAIGSAFAGYIDGAGHIVTREFTTKIIADTSKLANVKENVTVDNSKIKVNAIATDMDYTYQEYQVSGIENADDVNSLVAYGISNKNNGAARGNYTVDFNFEKNDIQALIDCGYNSFSFKYGIYQAEDKTVIIDHHTGNQLFPSKLTYNSTNSVQEFSINRFNSVEVSLSSLLNSFAENGAAGIFNIGGALDTSRKVYLTDFEIKKAEFVSILDLKSENFTTKDGASFGSIINNATLKTDTAHVTPCYSDTRGAWKQYFTAVEYGELNIQLMSNKSELEKVAKFYNKVKVSVLASNKGVTATSTNYIKLIKGEKGVFSSDIEFTGESYKYNVWYEVEVSVTDFMKGVSDDGVVTLFNSVAKNGQSVYFYLGDIQFSL